MPGSSRWLILELNDVFETITYREIEAAILTTFGEVEFFIPIYHELMGSYTSTSTLMEGYAFIKDSPENRQNIINLRDQRVFTGALCVRGKIQTLASEAIGVLKRKLKHSLKKRFVIGTRVRVLDGVFKKLVGEVIAVEENGKKIVIKIIMTSREIIAPIPSTLLEEIREIHG